MTRARERLEAAGIRWIDIPSGRYLVGATAGSKLMARPPQFSWRNYALAMSERWIEVTEPFAISRSLVTFDQVAKLTGERLDADEPPLAINLTEALAGNPRLQAIAALRWRNPDGIADVPFAEAQRIANEHDAALPRWYEWEIAVRGPEPFAYAWGNTLDLDRLTLRSHWYDDGMTRPGNKDQHLVLIDSFGSYASAVSPWGLEDVARIGREWNTCHEGQPFADDNRLVRSASDVGAMAYMVPGIRPGTYGRDVDAKERAFSGPIAACYGHASPPGHDLGRGFLWLRAAFRFVIRG
jgi:sulfatase-modifying factor enzyme 1